MRIRILNNESQRDPRETLDVFVGIVAFFTFAFFVIAAIAEVTGQDALGWALTLLAFVVLLALLLAARHRVTTRMRARPARLERPGAAPEKTDVIRP
ncbi:hypothetical protein HII28_18810 [Planctomonas sp. JC2975]|uniref:hypothetical protein n=1 Tax=Planctomonas sp. JC2975 TaxID=2729626 RepID=UPI0014732FED|nr:hypothetical protein [Planctomonas sp. JC2975]NNC13917.1 hypothetical protein [Planctomonas sp. JC2975]